MSSLAREMSELDAQKRQCEYIKMNFLIRLGLISLMAPEKITKDFVEGLEVETFGFVGAIYKENLFLTNSFRRIYKK